LLPTRPRAHSDSATYARFRIIAICWLLGLFTAGIDAAAPQVGELIRLTRGETLLVTGKRVAQASKGQEFTLVKRELAVAYVGYMKDDGSWLEAALPTEAIESAPAPAWSDLLRGFQAFRDGKYAESRALLAKAAQDKDQQVLANALAARLNGAVNAASAASTPATARQGLTSAVESLRDTASQLANAGRVSLALALDEGTDRLAGGLLGASLPASKVDRTDLKQRSELAERSYILARQAVGEKRLIQAKRMIAQGLQVEAVHPGLKAFQPTVKRGLEEAEELYETANKMRRFEKGAVHALSAIDDGLKICVDHPRLRSLRTEMSAQFEERTSPQVTDAFLARAKVRTSRPILDQGRQLYTNRCAECHELEMLDNRSIDGWERMVSGMARRANLSAAEKAQIMDYLTAALKVVETNGP
jgi:hypothetical protein